MRHKLRFHRAICSPSRCLAALALTALVSLSAVASSLAAGDANQGGCSAETEASAGFREYLADCRAYELVTPPFKEGFPVETILARSADGSRLLGQSLGAFAGTEVDITEGSLSGQGALYEEIRRPAGWSTVPLGPPASMFPESLLFSASTSLERTLWRLRSSTQPVGQYGLYVREAAASDGSCPAGAVATRGACFASIGPLSPPGKGPHVDETELNFVGASSDLTHVLIAKNPHQGLWPGDTTGGFETKSLYDYADRGASEPSLVGVRNGRSIEEEALLEHKGHINEAADLISRCGITLGSPEAADTYNAVSASGNVVFFTATECFEGPGEPAVNELYARVDGSETVDISEPSTGPTGDCEACDTSTPAPATFQGATEEGSKVFFLSEQAGLLPGAVGENLYEFDFNDPAHEKLVRVSGGVAESQVRGVVRVSTEGSQVHVYFVAGAVLAGNENANGETAQAGAENLYVYEPDPADPGHNKTLFVAMLCSGAGESGSVSDLGCQGSDEELWIPEDRRQAQATPDGRFLLFSSFAHLTADDTSSVQQLFEYDSQTGAMVRVSRGQLAAGAECAPTKKVEERFNCDGNTSSEALAPFPQPAAFTLIASPTKRETNSDISNDGAYATFESANRLVPGATLGLRNVYEYHDGNVYLISDGQDAVPARKLLGMDASGGNVFFTTADSLVGQDGDSQRDIYDARVQGGFPGLLAPQACSGESCQGSPLPPPGLAVAGSLTTLGGGNLPPPAPTPQVDTGPKKPMRAQQLAKALKACRKQPRKQRAKCKASAQKRYGAKPRKSFTENAKQGNRRGR